MERIRGRNGIALSELIEFECDEGGRLSFEFEAELKRSGAPLF